MNQLVDSKLCKLALEKDGKNYNVRKFMEECGENVAAISQYVDGKVDAIAVAEEFADLDITLSIMKEFVRETLSEDAVDLKIFEKSYEKKIDKFTDKMNAWACDTFTM